MASIYPRSNGRWRAQVHRNGKRASKVFNTEKQARGWAQRQEAVLEMAAAPSTISLQHLVEFHSLRGMLPQQFMRAAAEVSYSHDEIVGAAFPASWRAGVYFLIDSGRVTYVGQTTDLFQRLWKHQRMGRKFDSFAFIPCQVERLDEIENAYITFLMPDQNKMFAQRGERLAG